MRCEPIAKMITHHGQQQPLYECRAKLLWHEKYEGSLSVAEKPGQTRTTCYLIFHYSKVNNKTEVLRSPLKNKCETKKKKRLSAWGPWSRCLDNSCETDLSIRIQRRYCSGKKRCDELDFEDWVKNGRNSHSLIAWRPCQKCSLEAFSSSSSSKSISSSKNDQSSHGSSSSYSSHSASIKEPHELHERELKHHKNPIKLSPSKSSHTSKNETAYSRHPVISTTTQSTRLRSDGEERCSLSIDLADYDDLMESWPIDRPDKEFDCDYYDFFENEKKRYSQCECIILIEETAFSLKEIDTAKNAFIAALQQSYPVYKRDCRELAYYDSKKQKISLNDCLELRQNMKQTLRKQIEDYIITLYDTYDLYLQ